MSKINYNRRIWLNQETSHYTGSIVCFDGEDLENRGQTLSRYTFVEISDCHGKIRIHRDNNLPLLDFKCKLARMEYELRQFRKSLQDA